MVGWSSRWSSVCCYEPAVLSDTSHQSQRPVGVVSQWVEPQQGADQQEEDWRQSVSMACLMAAWSIHNPTVTNSIIMVSTPPGLDRAQAGLDWTGPRLDWSQTRLG